MAAALLVAAPEAVARSKGVAADDPSWNKCAAAAGQVEEEMGIPARLLVAVTLTETGRAGPDRRVSSWPWTVHDGTRGYHVATKEDAVALVRELRAGGRKSVDVGCMQVNLKHHPRAFTSVDEGFDPVVNIRYAATFLKRLKETHGTWEEAVARYHSYNPTYYEHYASKVLGFWAREKARMAAEGESAPTTVVASGAAAPRPAPDREDTPELRIALLNEAVANAPEAEVTAGEQTGESPTASDETGLTFFRTFGWPR